MIAALLRPFLSAETSLPEAVPDGVTVFRGKLIPGIAGVLSGFRGAAAAVTLGDAIVVSSAVPVTARLIRHELEHVRQWQDAPLRFPWSYLWNHLRHGYHNNPYEVAARQAESQPGAAPPNGATA